MSENVGFIWTDFVKQLSAHLIETFKKANDSGYAVLLMEECLQLKQLRNNPACNFYLNTNFPQKYGQIFGYSVTYEMQQYFSAVEEIKVQKICLMELIK